MRILFMGTPEFALFSLKPLVENNMNVIGVVTQPDKPKGRGYTLTPPPVKEYAVEHNIPVYQPTTLKGDDFMTTLCEINPDVIVVTAYGKILPQQVLDYPKYGCINVHGSLLPEYRGAAPMQRAIIDGKDKTGITTMYMDIGMDTGDMLLKREVVIEENDNFETIHDKLGAVSSDVLLETLQKLEEGTLVRIPQRNEDATIAAKISNEDCLVDFSKDASSIHNRIRGLSPFPLAYTNTPDGKMLKLVATELVEKEKENEKPGLVVALEKSRIIVNCGKGSIAITELLPEGKKKMKAADFINGRKIKIGDILGDK